MNIQNSLKGKEIVIDDSAIYNTIGKEAVLEDCTLKIRVPTKSMGIYGKLINTSIIAEKRLYRFSWLEATLIRCKFFGTYKENQFGNITNPAAGLTESCVFTDAVLNDCDFYGDLSKTHTFPKWPHFVLFDSHINLHTMKNSVKNDKISIIIDAIEYADEHLSAMTFNAPAVSHRLGITEEELKSFFSQFNFVSM